LLEGQADRDKAISGLAISPEGRQLFVVEAHAVLVVGTTDLEQSVITRKATLGSKLRGELVFPLSQRVSALSVAPDGRRLYVALRNLGPDSEKLEGEIRIHDAVTLAQIGDGIRVGRNPSVIALTPDGKRALVVNRDSNTVSILDAQRGVVVGQPVALGDTPVGAATLPDGKRALVIHQGPLTTSTTNQQQSLNLAIIDLGRQTRLRDIQLPEGAAQMLAVSPQGDRAYLTTTNAPLISVPLGTRLPVEWNSSGRVRPTCLPSPSHVVAVLGSVGKEKPMPASISQVVPVAGACAYEFSFLGLANQPDALAELFWLGGDCGLTRTDSVPIKLILPTQQQGPTFTLLASAFNGARVSALLLHRARFESPPGATQVEVRFSTPEGVVAVVESASLTATAEALTNADFRLVEDGEINGWTLSPTPAPGATLVASEGALRLRNAGADEVGLTQTVAVKGGQPFELEFQGGGESRPGARANPRLEVRWLGTDGAAAGDPATLNIVPTGFGSSSAKGVSPAAATQAEIRLIVPPGFTQEIKCVSLAFPVATLVPITFVAQAPGELTVSDLQVTFEQAEPKAPAIPPKGLCASTPPGRSPGDEGRAAETKTFCPCCGAASEIKEVQPVVTPAGRPARLVRCVNCGTEIVRVGGAQVAGAAALASTRLPVRQAVVQSRRSASPHHHGTEEGHTHNPAPEPSLTAIFGIGETRAQQLADMGFDSVSKLAAADPQDLTRLRLVALPLAEQFVAKAKELTSPEGENPQ
jgi:YVTN family beta-propeller protein